MARPRTPRPERVRIRMYQVGFGDCFLLSFEYRRALGDGRSVRHVLIDYGSTHRPPGETRNLLQEAARHLHAHTDGRIDAVVATHRHKDHIEGFARDSELVRGLDPELVLRPWTEDPDLEADATKPRDDPRGFAAMLEGAHAFAGLVAVQAEGVDPSSVRARLAAAAHDQVKNRAAIAQLDAWAKDGRGEYLSAGMSTRLERVVPGIRVRVLGPPTIADWPQMTQDRRSDPEYWELQAARLEAGAFAAAAAEEPPLVGPDGRPADVPLGPTSWLVERLRRQRYQSLLRIVRSVDDALNNTSLILLVDVGDKRLLFPGDAQIENWSWALQPRKRYRPLLANVDLYKVGHHGSRNASPRTLLRLWGDDRAARPVTALLSTLERVHGEGATAVPRATLVNALRRRTSLYTTNRLARGVPWIELEAPASGGGFRQVAPGG